MTKFISLSTLSNFLLDLLYPKRCLSCGKFGQYICDHCVSMIQLIDTSICPICRKPAIGGRTHPRCQTRYTLDGLISFFKYKGVIREAIKRIKYKPFAFDIAKSLVNLAVKDTDQSRTSIIQIIKEKPVLVPIPLHRSRERWRGFNQAEVLGEVLAEEWNLNFVPHLLVRIKKTQPQYGLDSKERKENIQDAFSVNSQFAIGNWKIILIDDIWTTGTTMRACGNLLKRAGAKSVWGLTMAR